jgi:hypothetical protein
MNGAFRNSLGARPETFGFLVRQGISTHDRGPGAALQL